MKIAYDLRRIKNPGIGRYMKGLAQAVMAQAPEHEYLLVLPPDSTEAIRTNAPRVEKVSASIAYYSVREQWQLPRLLRRYQVDVLHSPHFNLPLACLCPAIVTIHDVIYLACKRDLPSRLGRMYYRGMMMAAVRRASRVLTDSEFSKRDIVHHLHADPEKIEVVYPGVDQHLQRVTDETRLGALRDRFDLREEYILYTGIYKPRKNHSGLLHAFREFLAAGGRATLVIAGPGAEATATLRQMAAELGVADQVVLVGFVPEEDLAALYSAARLYACPSLYEGFGFTVLEAMACGVPVVCSAETSLPEVAGQAAFYADPRKPQEFAAAMYHAFTSTEVRLRLITEGMANCRRFRWENAARGALASYRQAVGAGAEQAVCA
jgi:glycosyltransferase involved in cell wall biosynthesis